MRELQIALMTIAIVTAGAAPSAAAIGDAEKCLAAKLKVVGKHQGCRFKAESVAVLKETAPDYTKCESKFSDSWQKTELKYGLDCVTDGDEVSINASADQDADIMVATLNGTPPGCGNNILECGEVCDGTNVGGETCATQGYDDGTIACSPTCTLDVSDCATHECDLLDQTGCMMGEACYPLGQSELCAGEGSNTEGQGCMFANSCVGGMACVSSVCRPMCDNIDSVPGCAVMQTCTNMPAWDGPNAGYCEP